MRRVGRPAVIGLVFALLFWLALTMAVGIQLARQEPRGEARVGLGPVALATGTVDGPERESRLTAAGYLTVVLIGVVPAGVTFARSDRRAGRRSARALARLHDR